jgi:hypothetical protein
MNAPVNLDPLAVSVDDAAARLAMLRALPLSDEPTPPEELAMLEEVEADVRAGRRGSGPTTAEMCEMLDQMRAGA